MRREQGALCQTLKVKETLRRYVPVRSPPLLVVVRSNGCCDTAAYVDLQRSTGERRGATARCRVERRRRRRRREECKLHAWKGCHRLLQHRTQQPRLEVSREETTPVDFSIRIRSG